MGQPTKGAAPARRPTGGMTRVSRIYGVGADGAYVVVRDVPDSGSESDALEVNRMARWIESLAEVESVEIRIRGVIREAAPGA